MTDNYESRTQQIIDRYIQASYGLWNALLTINGIILAAATLVSEISLIKTAISISALISIGLLVYNYVTIKAVYFRIAEVICSDPDKLTEDIKEKDINKSISRKKYVQYFENTCLGVLFLQAALVVIGFFCEKF